jgi:ADP-ribose pyrophosphatase
VSDPLPRATSREVVYRGRLFDVAVDEVEWPGGLRAKRETILHPGAVCMVPVDAEGRLLLVTQYRHAAGKRLLELPAGTLEPGEDPEPAAIRELQEEVGHVPARVTPLGGFYVAPGYTTEYIHLFVCTGLTPSPLDGDEDEDIEVERLTLQEALAAIDSGEICDGKSVVGILRYARRAGS